MAGSFSSSPASGSFLNAGQGQTLTASFMPDDTADFNAVPVTAQINVTPAPLTVTADDASMTAGQPLPAFTAHDTGFVRGEGPGVLGGTLSFSVSPDAKSKPGRYAITPGGLSSANYAITYANGTLTVAPTLVTVKSVQWENQKTSKHKTVKVLVVTFSGASIRPVPRTWRPTNWSPSARPRSTAPSKSRCGWPRRAIARPR